MNSGWTLADMPPLGGRRALITGATSGIGLECAVALAGRGAQLLLTGRNAAKGALALARIRAAHPDADATFQLCDVSSLDAVRVFAQRQADEARPLDMLINNAGVMALPRRTLSADGFEMQLATNVLGHVRLTSLLLPLLRAAPAARVVQLASLAHRRGRIALDDLNAERGYGAWRNYQQSKLAMLMFALELQRRSDAGGWGLVSTAAHPGLASTNLFRHDGALTIGERAMEAVAPHVCQSAEAGALPVLMAATATDVTPGGYYGPYGLFEAWGAGAGRAWIAPHARDEAMAGRLWDALTQMSGAVWP